MDKQYVQSYTDIKKLYETPEKYLNTEIIVCGWIKSFRKTGNKKNAIVFIKLSDGSCLAHLQIVINPKDIGDLTIIEKGKINMSIKVIGKLTQSPKLNQPIELSATKCIILGDILEPETYPLAGNTMTALGLRNVPHLRILLDTYSSIARIKSKLRMLSSTYFDDLGFHEVQVPLITDNECESGANPFTVSSILDNGVLPIDYSKDFFKKRCFLTVSGQLHLEAIMMGLSKVWTMTTAFRAEPSFGPLHMAEFWMLELEFAFSTLEDNMKVNEDYIKYCINGILKFCRPELEFLQKKNEIDLISMLVKYATKPFIISSHEECVKLLLADVDHGKVKFEVIPTYDEDLTKEHEFYITEILFDFTPVFVRYFPAKIKSFYMPKIDSGNKIEHCDCFDLLFPKLGEIVGGSQRESDYGKLLDRMNEMGVRPETMEFYSDLRKYGSVPHGGSGIGLDRLLMMMTGMKNIRDLIPFPRSYQSCLY